MNITIVGLDYEFVCEIAKALAQKLQMQYLDLEQAIDIVLLKSCDEPIDFADNLMKDEENKLIKMATKKENIIISVSDNTYLSNKHYEFFKNCLIVAIIEESEDKIILNLQKLLAKHSKISIKKSECSLQNLLNLIN